MMARSTPIKTTDPNTGGASSLGSDLLTLESPAELVLVIVSVSVLVGLISVDLV